MKMNCLPRYGLEGLMSKFALILNAKKDKIKELEGRIEELESMPAVEPTMKRKPATKTKATRG
jgi:hypothetical protein